MSISSLTDKLTITATFKKALDEKGLPLLLIHGGKTLKSLPSVKFSSSHSLKVNQKYLSDNDEAIRVLKDIIIPNVTAERAALVLLTDHSALLIMDASKDKTIDQLLKGLNVNYIILQTVPANVTYLIQLLDVKEGANGFDK